MITFIKKLFGLEKPSVTEAPYKVETPTSVVTPLTVGSEGVAPAVKPKAVVVENTEIIPVSFSDIPVMVATTKTPAKRGPAKPKVAKTPRTPTKPAAK